MLIEERMEELLKLVNAQGSLTVLEASTALQVSPDTIRRDFTRLSSKGLTKRTHGGIISRKNAIYEYTQAGSDTVTENLEKKQSIAEKAASLIREGESIILDGGTTTFEIAKRLEHFQQLTILTYGLNIACETSRHSHLSTILFGGIIQGDAMSALGPDAVYMIRHYHGDRLFLAANGVSLDNGLMTPNRMQADIKKELLLRTNQTIAVADSSKLGKTALFSFCQLDAIDLFITDDRADPAFITELNDRGINVLLASSRKDIDLT
jgi:DeoR family fructose operon transcriptional repressor